MQVNASYWSFSKSFHRKASPLVFNCTKFIKLLLASTAVKQLSHTLFWQDKHSKIRAKKYWWLTELSSSFSWTRLSSKSCSRVSVRPLTGEGSVWATTGEEKDGGVGEEIQGWAVIKEMEGRRMMGRGEGEETMNFSEIQQEGNSLMTSSMTSCVWLWCHWQRVVFVTVGEAVTDWQKAASELWSFLITHHYKLLILCRSHDQLQRRFINKQAL